MQGFLSVLIFALLIIGAFFVLGIHPFKRKTVISLSKQAAHEKKKNIDVRFMKLGLKEKLHLTIQNTVFMSGSSLKAFWLAVAAAGFLGIGLGRFLFQDGFLAVITGLAALPVPYIVFKVKARWYRRNQDELLENTMSIITNSYLSCNDILAAINENLDKLDIYKPFAEFITEVTLIDSNLKRGLRKLELKIGNAYFSEWIDILVLSQEQSGDFRFILPAIVQSMNDSKRLQIESDTVMMAVWREYFISIALSFSIIPLLRWSNAAWFEILVGTFAGKMLILLMLIMTLISAFVVMKINRPL